MIHADDRQDVERSFAKCVRNNVSQFGFECRQVSRTGEVRHILWAATTHADESGKIDLVSFVGRDISERKRIEAEQQARLDRLQTQQAIAVGMATHPAVATGNVEMASNALTEASAEAMNVERVGVYLMSQDGRELKAADVYTRTSARHIDGPSLPIGDCPRYFEYLRSDRVIPAVHAHTDKRMSELIAKSMAPYEVSSRLDAPVRVAGMLVGVVSFQHVGPVRIWTDDEIGFACDVADLIAQAQLNDERRRTEASLKTSEERFRTLAENIPGVIYLCKYEPRCSMLYLNNTIEQLTGYPKSEFFSDRISLAALYHPDDAAEIHAQINEALSLRVPYHLTYRLKHRTGEWRWIEEHGVGLYHDDRPEAIEGYMIDVTTRRREAEERLLLSEAIAQAAEIVIVTDTNGVIQYVNPAFEKTTGYARQEAVGLTPRIMKSGRHSEEFYREMWQALGAGQSWRGRFVNKKKDGSLYTEEALHFPVRDARGRIIRYVGVKRDISEEVKLEEQLRQAKKMEAIGQLAGGVAHDFNNLLTPILGHAELLLMRDDLDETLRTSLGEVQRAAENARDLTQQLLAFSRRQVIEMRPLDLGRIVLRVTRMFRRTLRENIEIVLNLSPDLGCVRGDAVQMEQVLMNLILNAQDAMNRGGLITIETANCYFEDTTALTHQELKPGSYVMLAVSDSGTGMSHETMEHLFEPFFTTKSLGKGTGLGLATVYGVIKQHQGDIYVYSEPDRGTTFKIYLPEVKERPAALTGGEGEAGKIRRGAETIMVVEDNEQVRMFACAVLRSHGYRVVEAASAEECLVTCETFYGPIHLLLSDIVMPGLNGRELYTLLVEQRPDLKVLFMSGYTDDVIVHQGFLDAEIEFIQKPFTVDRLTRRVRECLDQQRDD
jgi:PAS domain S-box-containing protein